MADSQHVMVVEWRAAQEEIERLRKTIERLRAALQDIIDVATGLEEAEAIARRALDPQV
jgi:hypothetical protein